MTPNTIRSGSAGRTAARQVAPYCASKWAVVSLTQSGARDLAKHDITVTGFAPGVVATEMWEEVDRDLMEIGAAERSFDLVAWTYDFYREHRDFELDASSVEALLAEAVLLAGTLTVVRVCGYRLVRQATGKVNLPAEE